MRRYVCTVCGYIYDEAVGYPAGGIAPGTPWEAVPEGWVCPVCGAGKAEFREQADVVNQPEKEKKETAGAAAGVADKFPGSAGKTGKYQAFSGKAVEAGGDGEEMEELRELTAGELSAICSNLARGSEKQYLAEEASLFMQLADYFKKNTPEEPEAEVSGLLSLLHEDLEAGYPAANEAAGAKPDRGALRALVWGEKVSRIVNSILQRYEKEGDALLEHTSIYVCDICGFIYIGDTPPALCPVCKVPGWKMTKMERGQAG